MKLLNVNINFKLLQLIKMTHEQLKNEILSPTDGPVTKFVVISRSFELFANGLSSHDDISNVLFDILEDFNEIPSNEFNNLK